MEDQKIKQHNIILNASLVVLVLIIAIFAGKYFYGRLRNTYTDDARVQQQMVPVNARVGGYLQEIRFEEFTPVKKGDTLLIIDPTDYRIHLAQAEAGLESAQANLEVMKATATTLRNAQAIANANLGESKARLWNAEQNYKRFEQLVKENSATKQQFDQVKTDYESAQARHTATVKAAEGSKLATIEAETRLKAAEAGIKQAEAGLQAARQNLDYTIVLAPCDGMTGHKDINPGQLVQGGQTLIQIVDENKKWVMANFLEKRAKDLKIGQQVEIEVDALPEQSVSGTIESIAGATGSVFSMVPTDNATGNFVKVQQRIPVRIAFDPATSPETLTNLRAGMNVEVFVK